MIMCAMVGTPGHPCEEMSPAPVKLCLQWQPHGFPRQGICL